MTNEKLQFTGDKWVAYLGAAGARAWYRAGELARGCYQREMSDGFEAHSGSTLKGKARNYKARYAQSRDNWLARCRAVGIDVKVVWLRPTDEAKHRHVIVFYGMIDVDGVSANEPFAHSSLCSCFSSGNYGFAGGMGSGGLK